MTGSPAISRLLCEKPLALAGEVLRRRIYAPQAYAPVRDAAAVPIVHSECLALAAWFPLVWQRRNATFEFVAIRALLNDQRAQPPAARALMPLLLHAYPFVLDPQGPPGPDTPKMLDDVFADTPTDVGASITTVQRRLARATTMRFRVLDRFATESVVTAAIGRALAELDAFEPWNLQFDIEGRRVGIPDLVVIKPTAFDSGQFARLLDQFGMPCAEMLALHRVSLFRAGALLAMARACFKNTASPVANVAFADTSMAVALS
jgi:hypothetical protein